MLKELDRFCGSLTGSMVAVRDAQGARSCLWVLDGVYGCCGESRGARSFLWKLDRVFGWCKGGSRSSIVSVGDRRALWLLWGCSRSSIISVGARRGLWLLWGNLENLDRCCGSSTGSLVGVREAQGARSFLWELDGLYGCCKGGSRSSIVSVGA